MGQSASTPAIAETVAVETNTTAKPPKKVGIKSGKPICCCCPDTKKPRDECVVFKGEDDPECQKMIEAHKMCLRAEGFNVK